MNNHMWEDIKTWSGGDDTLHGKLKSVQKTIVFTDQSGNEE